MIKLGPIALLLFIPLAHSQEMKNRAAFTGGLSSLPDAPSRSESPSQNALPAGELLGPEPQRGTSFSNLRSYSVDEKLPAQSVKAKFKLGLEDSFGLYSFVLVGAEAGVHQATNQYPAFRQGAAGYSRYYWHSFADQADENLWVVSILPLALHEDSRYYRLGRGGIFKRAGYALSRTVITRTDSGGPTFNVAETIGAGAAAGISSTYYPGQYRTWTKTGQRWLSNVVLDGATFAVKEFLPDVERALFHRNK
ncbi:hypothetical protein [Terriglobus sp. ADX1]|uniref:hypothetical protein n=1 Tax=Terriglobus sp. ADX1 TaxID=2794063 RepID=UPI002FE69AA5